MSNIRYSPRPLTDYVRLVGGARVGPGANPLLVGNLAAWNLFFLSYPHLETHTDFGGAADPVPHHCPVAEYAAVTAGQFAGASRVRDLCTHLPPDRFLAQLQHRPVDHLALAKFFKKDTWLAVMQSRVGLYLPHPDIDSVPGSVLTRQLDGTSRRKSTNILPLSRLLH